MDNTADYIIDISTKLKQYYKKNFSDNNKILEYLEDISKTGGNYFDDISKQILKVPSNNDINFFKRTYKIKNIDVAYDKQDYCDILYILKALSYALYDLYNLNDNFIDTYKQIKTIEIVNITDNEEDITVFSDTEVFTNYSYDDLSTLTLNLPLNIDHKFDFKEYTYDNKTNIDKNDIIDNYMSYILSFKKENLKLQIYAFYFYINILYTCLYFIMNIQMFYINKTQKNSDQISKVCAYFQNYIEKINNLKNDIENKENQFNGKIIFATVIDECPIKLNFHNNDVVLNENQILETDFVVLYNGINYDIVSSSHIKSANSKQKNIINCIIRARTYDIGGCSVYNTYDILEVKKNNVLEVYLKLKDISKMQKEYREQADNINIKNKQIDYNKDKYNTLVKQNNKHQKQLKYINIQLYLSIFIFVVFILYYLSSYQITDNKILYAIVVFIIAFLIVLFVNLKNPEQDIYEGFDDTPQVIIYKNDGSSFSLFPEYNTGSLNYIFSWNYGKPTKVYTYDFKSNYLDKVFTYLKNIDIDGPKMINFPLTDFKYISIPIGYEIRISYHIDGNGPGLYTYTIKGTNTKIDIKSTRELNFNNYTPFYTIGFGITPGGAPPPPPPPPQNPSNPIRPSTTDVCGQPDFVTGWTGVDFQGQCYYYYPKPIWGAEYSKNTNIDGRNGYYEYGNNTLGLPNDSMRSIQIPYGMQVILYYGGWKSAYENGASITLTSDVSDLDNYTFTNTNVKGGNQVSGVQVNQIHNCLTILGTPKDLTNVVAIYSETNFNPNGGAAAYYDVSKLINSVQEYDFNIMELSDNNMESIKIPDGYRVTLFQHFLTGGGAFTGDRGAFIKLNADEPNLNRYGMGDTVTSMKISRYPYDPINKVGLFTDINFKGSFAYYGLNDQYNNRNILGQIIPLGNDNIPVKSLRSIKIPEIYKVTLYQDPNTYIILDADTSNLNRFDYYDNVTSFKIESLVAKPNEGNYINLYTDYSYQGTHFWYNLNEFTLGTASNLSELSTPFPDKELRSIQIPNSCNVTLSKSNKNNMNNQNSITLNANDDDLSIYGFEDSILSIKITNNIDDVKNINACKFFTKKYFEGTSKSFGLGTYNFNQNDIGIFSYALGSLKVYLGYQITFFIQDNGKSFTHTYKGQDNNPIDEDVTSKDNNVAILDFTSLKNIIKFKIEQYYGNLQCSVFFDSTNTQNTPVNTNNYIINNTNDMHDAIVTLVSSYQYYLSSAVATKMMNNITQSMYKEEKIYNHYNAYYDLKLKNAKDKVNDEKLDIIYKTKFIQFICYTILSLAFINIIHSFINDYDKLFLLIGLVVVIMNIIIYYIMIIRPVRRKAYNAYWRKPQRKLLEKSKMV